MKKPAAAAARVDPLRDDTAPLRDRLIKRKSDQIYDTPPPAIKSEYVEAPCHECFHGQAILEP